MLMAQKRDTLVTRVRPRRLSHDRADAGHAQRWPEGAFYGFDDIYGAERLAYGGPPFGWFAIPDQFSLARLDALEAAVHRAPPLFVVLSDHQHATPFSPTPPYQPDWTRMLTAHPYDDAALGQRVRARSRTGPISRRATWSRWPTTSPRSAGICAAHADRDIVMILLGDHQPPAAVSGEGASWDVPVHVIANRTGILDRFVAHGFTPGLTPARAPLGPMNHLATTLLQVFDSR